MRIRFNRNITPVYALSMLLAVPLTHAQGNDTTYPNRPIRLIVPDAPGGLPDTFARTIGDPLAARIGQPVIVDNRPGAGGIIGTQALLQAPADGYSLLFSFPSNQVVSPLLQKSPPYHPVSDFAPVALAIVNTGGYLVANASLPFSGPRDLIEYARAKPGALNFASAGTGSITHLAIELFKIQTGTNIVHVPYKGPAPGLLAVVSGEAQLTIPASIGATLPHIKAGKVRLIARLGTVRSPDFPDVPTLAESVAPGLVVPFWMGVVARQGTPASIIARLNQEINAVVASPAIKSRADAMALVPTYGPPELLANSIKRDHEVWGRVIRENRIVAD